LLCRYSDGKDNSQPKETKQMSIKNKLNKNKTIILAAAVAFWRLRKAYEPLHFLAILSYR